MTASLAVKPEAISTCRAGVSADLHRHQLYATIADDADPQALGAEEQRVRGNHEVGHVLRHLEVNKNISAGKQLALRVVDIDLDVEGAGGLIDSVGVARDRAFKRLAGILVEGEGGLVADVDGGGVDLRNGDVRP